MPEHVTEPGKPLGTGTDLGETAQVAVAEEPVLTIPAATHEEVVSLFRTLMGRFTTFELEVAQTLNSARADITRLSRLLGVD